MPWPLGRPGQQVPAYIRVLQRVTVGHSSGCWLVGGRLTEKGYSTVTVGAEVTKTKRTAYSHRVIYERYRGAIPPGLTLDHFRLNEGPRKAICSRACVNPSHLEPVTLRENILRSGGMGAKNARKAICPTCGGEYRLRVIAHSSSVERVCPHCIKASKRKSRAKCRAKDREYLRAWRERKKAAL